MENLSKFEKDKYNTLIQIIIEKGNIIKSTIKKGISKQEEIDIQQKIQKERNFLIKDLKLVIEEYKTHLNDSNIAEIFKNYLQSQQILYEKVSKLQKEFDELKERENPVLKELVVEFQNKLQELDDYVSKELQNRIKIPWQIRYCAERDESGSVSFSGGVIKDSQGVPIWEVKCYYCGIVIEHGSEGEGTERYHCQECEKGDICIECFEIKSCIETSLNSLDEKIRLEFEQNLKEKDQHYQHVMCKENYHSVWLRNQVVVGKTPGSRINKAFKVYANRYCIGTRSKNSNTLDEYDWLTYKELEQKVKSLSYYMKKLFPKRTMVGICLHNCNEWMISDFACSLLHFLCIGIHTTYDKYQLINVINNSDINVLICNKVIYSKISQIYEKCPKLKTIILTDKIKVEEMKIETFFFEDFLNYKEEIEFESLDEIPKEKPSQDAPENLFTIIFTSGSSGSPKGVMITYETFMEDTSHSIYVFPFVTPSYIPLSHSTDRLRVWETLLNGGRVGFANYDPKNWSEHESGKKKVQLLNSLGSTNGVEELIYDIKVLKPTIMIAPPRIWNGLYTIYLNMLNEKPNDICKEDFEKSCQQKVKMLLGGRIKHVATGGELINDFIVQFIKNCFNDSQFDESYGCTECGGITMNGLPMHNVTYKIIPVLELGESENKGEIIVKSNLTSIGYYKLPQETKESFKDGYFYTGDLGEILKDGTLKIIGRKKNFVELGKDKYYQPDLLESNYSSCSLIDQICITNQKEDLIFIIVTRNQINEKELLEKVIEFGKSKELESHFLPKKIIVSKEFWNLENGMLTTSLKINRKVIIEYFKLNNIDIE